MYFERDTKLNLNPLDVITKALNKLGYYKFDYNKMEDNYVVSEVKKRKLHSNELETIAKRIKVSDEFNKYKQYLSFRDRRFNELNRFLENPNLERFYQSLTTDELEYLGY